jgi:hypothetical protein
MLIYWYLRDKLSKDFETLIYFKACRDFAVNHNKFRKEVPVIAGKI